MSVTGSDLQPALPNMVSSTTTVELVSLPGTATETSLKPLDNKVVDVSSPIASPSADGKVKNQAWSEEDPETSPSAARLEDPNAWDYDDDPTSETFIPITSAQQRMGAKFGKSDSGETIEVRNKDNILIYMAVYFGSIAGFIFQDDCYWAFWLNFGFVAAHWIYFFLVPVKYRLWKDFGAMFGLTRQIEKTQRVHKAIPYLMVGIVQANAICNLALIYVWGNQLPSYTRVAGRSALSQTKVNYALDSNDNAAQSLGQLCVAFPIGIAAVGFFVFYAATRGDLSPRGRQCLSGRREFLREYHTSVGTNGQLLKIAQDVEETATARVKTRWTPATYALIVILSIFNGVVIFILQKQVIWMAWQSAPGIVVVFLFSCLFVATPGTAMLCYSMDFVSCYFLECSQWMDQLCYLELDLTDITDLLFWQELRNYYLKWRIPTQYHFAQMGFAVCLLMTLITYTSIVLIIFVQGTHMLFEMGIQMAFGISLVASVYLVITLTSATKVWDHQQQHTDMLDDIILKLRFRLALTATPALHAYTVHYHLDEITHSLGKSRNVTQTRNSIVSHGEGEEHVNLGYGGGALTTNSTALSTVSEKYALTHAAASSSPQPQGNNLKRNSTKAVLRNASVTSRYNIDYVNRVTSTLERQITKIKELDPAPKIFGINIKPTLLRVIAGYCVSALAVVITKFFQG